MFEAMEKKLCVIFFSFYLCPIRKEWRQISSLCLLVICLFYWTKPLDLVSFHVLCSHSISKFEIYYGTQSNPRVESYGRLKLLRDSVLNYEHLDILRDSIGHPSKKLLSFELVQSFRIQFRASRCITRLNQTSE